VAGVLRVVGVRIDVRLAFASLPLFAPRASAVCAGQPGHGPKLAAPAPAAPKSATRVAAGLVVSRGASMAATRVAAGLVVGPD
jgi:hypothetical protein